MQIKKIEEAKKNIMFMMLDKPELLSEDAKRIWDEVKEEIEGDRKMTSYKLIEENGKKFLLITKEPVKVDLEIAFGGKENIPNNIEEMVNALCGGKNGYIIANGEVVGMENCPKNHNLYDEKGTENDK